jgi:hypothetical protein
MLLALCLCLALLAGRRAQAQSTKTGPPEIYPDAFLTPGEAFLTVGAAQVCASGYARTARAVSNATRIAVFAAYGLAPDGMSYELDHFIPLELGGDNAPANLWPEPYTVPGAHEKDVVENYLHDRVCTGTLDLVDAQNLIADDWYAVYLALQGEGTLPGGHIWYTSTGPAATAYYCDDDPLLQTFSHTILRAFGSVVELLAAYPGRHLHQPCLDGTTGV